MYVSFPLHQGATYFLLISTKWKLIASRFCQEKFIIFSVGQQSSLNSTSEIIHTVTLHLTTIQLPKCSVGESTTAEGCFPPLVWPGHELPSVPYCGSAHPSWDHGAGWANLDVWSEFPAITTHFLSTSYLFVTVARVTLWGKIPRFYRHFFSSQVHEQHN